jgi:sigma-B regulation protein RsbU (phosphoserine phosphatase)
MLGDSELFLTLVFCIFNEEKNQLEILSAGHSSVFFISNKEGIKTIESTGMPLGWFPDISWEPIKFSFDHGESLFLCTDGIIEAKEKGGEQFGSKRLINLLQENSKPDVMIDNIFKQVEKFCESNFSDDMTMLAVRRK